MGLRDYPHSYEKTVIVDGSPAAVFHELDDHERLAAHMMDSSVMMGGQAMRFEFDEDRGRAVGSKITMAGRVLGIELAVDEVVVDRVQPRAKAWETIGEPRLLVIDHYRMGFNIEPFGEQSRLMVFIFYRLPRGLLGALGSLLGGIYARWCVNSMATGALRRFARASHSASIDQAAHR